MDTNTVLQRDNEGPLYEEYLRRTREKKIWRAKQTNHQRIGNGSLRAYISTKHVKAPISERRGNHGKYTQEEKRCQVLSGVKNDEQSFLLDLCLQYSTIPQGWGSHVPIGGLAWLIVSCETYRDAIIDGYHLMLCIVGTGWEYVEVIAMEAVASALIWACAWCCRSTASPFCTFG